MPDIALSSVSKWSRLFSITNSGGPTLTAAVSGNTKGGYVTLIDPVPHDCGQLLITIGIANGNARDFLIDLAIGAASSEIVIVSNLLYTPGSDDAIAHYNLPLWVPSGVRLSARVQCSTANATVKITAHGAALGLIHPAPYQRATTYGAATSDSGATSVDPGGSADTKGSWTQLDSAIANPIRSLLVCIGNARNNNMVGQYEWLLDIGVGAGGSEQVIIPDLYYQADANSDARLPSVIGPLPCDIPAGTRLSARQQCSGTDATDRLTDIAVIGLD